MVVGAQGTTMSGSRQLLDETVHVRTKHTKKTRVDLWGQSTILKAVFLGLPTDPTNQHESFQRVLCPLARFLGNFPEGHPSQNCSK